jgi:hypothetical protein
VPRGHRPAVEEGIELLDLLRTRGSSADAFTFGNLFPAPGPGETVGNLLEATCPAS